MEAGRNAFSFKGTAGKPAITYCTLVLQWATVALTVSFSLSRQVVVQGQVLVGFLGFKL